MPTGNAAKPKKKTNKTATARAVPKAKGKTASSKA
jgi:hypothetical protein